MKNRLLREKISKHRICLFSFIATLFILVLLSALYGFAPFGDRTFATMDANNQYLDYFAYLKNILSGDADFSYSFSKGLGGTNIAVFSYYLSSPFNLLILFFKKGQIPVFFNIITILKCATASLTAGIFLNYRTKKNNTLTSDVLLTILSVNYGLCQYCLAQASNTMWIDGVYMLPLILLGVSKLVRTGRINFILPFSVTLSIIFNWYSAGINCLFSIIWFIFENLLLCSENGTAFFKTFFSNLWKYVLLMALGVLVSCFVFIPTIGALMKGEKAALELNEILNPRWIGNIFALAENYSIGGKSIESSTALFCGSLPVTGSFALFFDRKYSFKSRLCFMGLMALMMLSLIFSPLVCIFSLLRNVYSFFCRYSYIVIFTFVALSGLYFGTFEEEKTVKPIALGSCIPIAVILISHIIINYRSTSQVLITLTVMAFSTLVIILSLYFKGKGRKYALLYVPLCLFLLAECAFNAKILMSYYSVKNVDSYRKYSELTDAAVSRLKETDNGTYRVSQTSTRMMRDGGLTATYNDALAYDYNGIVCYTSSPDESSHKFLDMIGYRSNGAAMNIVNTSIVSADSLLGVKYVYSPYEINGLKKISDNEVDEKDLYLNEYALPLAFLHHGSGMFDYNGNGNPFEFQNSLYAYLSGNNEIPVFEKLSFRIDNAGEGIRYIIDAPEYNCIIYGNLPWGSVNPEDYPELDVNSAYSIYYAKWLSQSVFHIPAKDGANEIYVTASNDYLEEYESEAQFYALNLENLSRITELIKKENTCETNLKDGYVKIKAYVGNESGRLFVSVPYDSNWTVTVNGEPATYSLIEGSVYDIALNSGDNTVEFSYSVPLMIPGIIVSIAGLIILAVLVMHGRKQRDLLP